MRVGSLFAGIGGFDLAAHRVGWETAWFSEIDPYACKVLAKHWPDVPNHGDITKIDFTRVEPVDVLCGGFPCQDISVANPNGKGLDGARSGLWTHYARAIRTLRPQLVVVENSSNLLGRGLGVLLGNVAALGYDAEWHCIPAAAVGAPHIRDRIWVVAYAQSLGWPPTPLLHQDDVERCRLAQTAWRSDGELLATDHEGEVWCLPASRPERVVDGVPNAMDRVGGCGNAVVPQIPELLFRAIQARI